MIRHTHPTHTTFVTYIYTRIVKYTSISHTHTHWHSSWGRVDRWEVDANGTHG